MNPDATGRSLVGRFRESMVMNHERWHDGTGYDLGLLETAAPDERRQIESLLTSKSVDDWRDVEALACIDTPRAREMLRGVFEAGGLQMPMLVAAYAPGLLSDRERSDVLAAVLQSGDGEVLSRAMLEVGEYHPPRVLQALWEGLRTRDAQTATEFAMQLLVIHGKADSLYDLDVRRSLPSFEGAERGQAIGEFCDRLGCRPEAIR